MTTLAAVSSNSIAPGTLGFLVIFGMAVVLTLLFRSMSKHLRKVNEAARKDEQAGASASSVDTSPDTGDGASTGPGSQRRDF